MPLVTRDKSEVFYLVLSPRMDDSTYASWMKKGNVPLSNVLTINSAKDLPHWSDPSMMHNVVFNTGTNPVAGIAYNFAANAPKFWHDYDHNKEVGTHIYLDEAVTKGAKLDHGSMVHGLYNGYQYNVVVNGHIVRRETEVLTLINKWLTEELNGKRK